MKTKTEADSRASTETPAATDQFERRRLELCARMAGRNGDHKWHMDRELVEAYYELRGWPPDLWPRPDVEVGAAEGVVMVGKGPAGYFAPWGRKGWEFWGLNEAQETPPIAAHTRWFQLHPPRYLKRHHPPGVEDLDYHWQDPRGMRLYMDRHYVRYPDSESFPKEQVEALTTHGWYHASSFDWMLGLAVLEGFKRIELWGVEFYQPPLLNGDIAR